MNKFLYEFEMTFGDLMAQGLPNHYLPLLMHKVTMCVHQLWRFIA